MAVEELPEADFNSVIAKLAYENHDDSPPFIPTGYRLLLSGEMTRHGDLYWSNGRWYRLACSAECSEWGEHLTPFVRRKGE